MTSTGGTGGAQEQQAATHQPDIATSSSKTCFNDVTLCLAAPYLGRCGGSSPFGKSLMYCWAHTKSSKVYGAAEAALAQQQQLIGILLFR